MLVLAECMLYNLICKIRLHGSLSYITDIIACFLVALFYFILLYFILLTLPTFILHFLPYPTSILTYLFTYLLKHLAFGRYVFSEAHKHFSITLNKCFNLYYCLVISINTNSFFKNA
jgi:hypothetical protein